MRYKKSTFKLKVEKEGRKIRKKKTRKTREENFEKKNEGRRASS